MVPSSFTVKRHRPKSSTCILKYRNAAANQKLCLLGLHNKYRLDQHLALEDYFKMEPNPDTKAIKALDEKLDLEEVQAETWFSIRKKKDEPPVIQQKSPRSPSFSISTTALTAVNHWVVTPHVCTDAKSVTRSTQKNWVTTIWSWSHHPPRGPPRSPWLWRPSRDCRSLLPHLRAKMEMRLEMERKTRMEMKNKMESRTEMEMAWRLCSRQLIRPLGFSI